MPTTASPTSPFPSPLPWRKTGWRYGLSLLIAVLLCWGVFASSDTSLADIITLLHEGNPMWLLIGLGLAFFAFVLRAYRWHLLLVAAEARVAVDSAFWALMSGYLVNFALPRLGEIFRCSWLLLRSRAAFATIFGTVAAERLVDIFCMGLLVIVALFLEASLLTPWLEGHAYDGQQMGWMFLYVLVGLLLVVGLSIFFRQRYPAIWVRLRHFVARFWAGMLSLRRMASSGHFYGLTLLMWGSYFLSNYAFLQAYGANDVVPLQAGVVLLATSSLGMTLPLPGGFGSYHALVQWTFLQYGLKPAPALTVAVAIHMGYSVLVLLLGGLGLLFFFIQKRKIAPKQ